jgi:hypothetical protein
MPNLFSLSLRTSFKKAINIHTVKHYPTSNLPSPSLQQSQRKKVATLLINFKMYFQLYLCAVYSKHAPTQMLKLRTRNHEGIEK